jgi:hypothetical protein
MHPRQSNRKPLTPVPATTAGLTTNYAIMELVDQVLASRQETAELKQLIITLTAQNHDLKLSLLEEKNTGHFTLDEVEKYFDISKRLQQQDRSEHRLGYLKKKNGAKILYTTEQIREYLKNEFEEYQPTNK